MKKLKQSAKLIALLTLICLSCMSARANDITLEMEGTIGNYPATICITMKNGKAVSGYYWFKGSNAPQSGKIYLSGTCRHDPSSSYPWYDAVLTAKTTGGNVCGKWNVGFETRTGTLEGTCTINGRKYDVTAEEVF